PPTWRSRWSWDATASSSTPPSPARRIRSGWRARCGSRPRRDVSPTSRAGFPASCTRMRPARWREWSRRSRSRERQRPAMALPFRLLVITDRSLMGEDPVSRATELARAQIPGWALQWRDPQATTADLYRDLLAVRDRLVDPSNGAQPAPVETTANPGLRILVNDRVDVAAALGLDAHLKETSLPTRAARALLPPPSLLGRSAHAANTAQIAAAEGADYVLF